MKYEDFNDFFSNLDVNKNEINSKWKELSARKRKKTLVTFIVILIINYFLPNSNCFIIRSCCNMPIA